MATVDLSIIAPMYNEVDIARDSVQKILQQVKMYNLSAEIIIVDDKSSDGSLESLMDIENIRLYQMEKNSGSAGPPRNFGMKEAIGRYLMFYDMGDDLNLEPINKYLAFMDNFDVNIIIFKHQDVYNERAVNTPIQIFRDEVYSTTLSETPALISNPFSWGKLFRKNWLDNHGIVFGSQYLGEDKLFTWKTYIQANQIVISPFIIYGHRFYTNDRNRMVQNNYRSWRSVVDLDSEMHPYFKIYGHEKLYLLRLINRDVFGIILSKNGILKLIQNNDLEQVLIEAKDFISEKLPVAEKMNCISPDLMSKVSDLNAGRYDVFVKQVLSES